MAASEPSPALSASPPASSGGINISGGIINARDFVAGDKNVVITAEQAYDVRGLANPYLGLATFTYADRAKYAGRENQVNETITKLTAPAAPLALLFVTGASGSGKSSFVQAGLLPAVEAHYSALAVKHGVFRPGAEPVAALADAVWRQLGLPPLDPLRVTPESFANHLAAHTPVSQINLLVLDQFEELFTQSAAAPREALFEILAQLPSFAAAHTHLVATLRADYLPDLFKLPALFEIAKQGVELRVMSVDELRVAIQQPLRAAYSNGDKRFEPALVDKLAADAAQDAAYLPLLQVTLEELWRKGSLTLGAYTNLTDAIEERADKVLQFCDYDAAVPSDPRSQAEQEALLDLLLSLVNVSVDDDSRRDVRQQRTKDELAHGASSAETFARVRWIDQLAQARLLTLEAEPRDPTRVDVDLIHESLLTNWDRLHAAIAQRRQQLRQRARFEQNLGEWLAQNRSDDYLLDGVRLAEARDLEGRGDIALQNENSKAFLRASIAKVEAERQAELELERQRAAAEKLAREEAEKRAASEKLRAEEQVVSNRRLRRRALYLIGALVLALFAIGAALLFLNQSNAQRKISESRRLAAQSTLLRGRDLDLSLLLGIEAVRLDPNFEARNNLLTALEQTQLTTTLYGHPYAAWSVTFSPDGKRLASAGCGEKEAGGRCIQGEIRMWDVSSGQAMGRPLRGHTSTVNKVVFSPDGKRLASASSDNTIRLWDVETGQAIGAPLAGHTDRVTTVVFSPDGRNLASGSYDKTIRLWDVASGKQVGPPLTGHTDIVHSVAFSPDGKLLASGSCGNVDEMGFCIQGEIRFWDVSTVLDPGVSAALDPGAGGAHEIGEPLTGHTNRVTGVVFNRDGTTLASSSWDKTVRLWDVAAVLNPGVAKGKQIGAPLTGHTDLVESVAFSPDGKMLVTAGQDKTVRLWDAASGQEIGDPLTGHTDTVYDAAFSPDGMRLASASNDGTVRLWDVSTRLDREMAIGRELGEPLLGHTSTVLGVAFSPDGKTLASAGFDRMIRLWDVSSMLSMGAVNGRRLGQLTGHTDAVQSVAFSPDGKILASGSADKTIRLWDALTWREIGSPLTGHSNAVQTVAFSPDGRTLASGGCGRIESSGGCTQDEIRFWSVERREEIGQPLTGHTNAVYSVAFSPDGKLLASGSLDKTIQLWDVPTMLNPSAASGPAVHTALVGHTDAVLTVAFSPDGKTLASGSLDQTLRLWDVSAPFSARGGDGKQAGQPLMGHSDRVTGVAFSPDDKTLASVSQDQTIRLWDWTNGQEIGQPLFGHTNAVLAMAFSPDGKLLASGGADNAIRVWDVDLNLDVEEMGACHIANRNLTRAEWREYFATDSTSYDSVYAKNPTCPGLPIEPAPTPTPDAASGGTITPSPLPTP